MSQAIKTLLAVSLIWSLSGVARSEEPRKGTLGDLRARKLDLPPEAPLAQANERARRSYQEYLDQPRTDPKLVAEALRRLGDLELDDADLSTASAEVRLALYKSAVGHYRDLLTNYANYERDEKVLYQLARAEEGSGNPEAALEALALMASRYPQSPQLAEAQFRRGEILFVKKRFEEAESAFTATIAAESSGPSKGAQGSYSESARYKQAWSRLKQDEYQSALDAFFQVLDGRLDKVPGDGLDAHMAGMTRPERELIDDSLRGMALACQSLGPPKTVTQQLKRRGDPAYGYLLYQSLAAIYSKQERYNDTSATLMSFVDAHPEHSQAPEFVIQAISAQEAGGFSTQAVSLREAYVKRFGLEQPFWKVHKPEEQTEAFDYLRESIWTLAQLHHALAQDKASKPPVRAKEAIAAADQYRLYTRYFPKEARAPQVQFLLGDLLYETGDARDSVKAYEAAAYDYPAFDRRGDAAFASLQAYQKRESELKGAARDSWRKERLKASLRFADTFTDRKEAALVKANTASGQFEAGDVAPAIATAEAVIKNPKANNEARRIAWSVIGLASFDTKDYSRAEASYLEAQKLTLEGTPEDADISERLAAAIYRQGEVAQADGKSQRAAEHFSRVAQEAPATKIRATADYDAAMATLKSGQALEAIPMLVTFRDRYKTNPLAAEATRTLAATYEKIGRTQQAAWEFQRVAETPGNAPDLQRDALWHSIELLEQVDRPSSAAPLAQYVERFPVPFDTAIEAHQKLIDLATTRGNLQAAERWSLALMSFEASGKPTARSRSLAAKASLMPAQTARNAYRAVRLSQPLKASLDVKRQRLEQAITAYAKAADYGVASVLTESTFETADLYHEMARALKQSDRPRDLDAAALEQYNLLLEEQIFPFEDKAIAIHEGNARRAREGLFDDWVQKSFAALGTLSPGRYAKADLADPAMPIAPKGRWVWGSAKSRYAAAVLQLQAGDFNNAESGFKALQVEYPKLPGPAVQLALLYRQTKESAKEEATIRDAVERWPEFAPAHHQMGLWLRRKGSFTEADAELARAIDLDAKYPAAHYDRGVLNDLYLQRPRQAIEEYAAYQKLLSDEDPVVARWMTDLQRRGGPTASSRATQ